MARLGQAPVRYARPALGESASDLGAPGQRFHNVKPVGGAALGDADDVSGTAFLAQEGDHKGAILLGDVSSLLAGLGAAEAYKDYDTKDGYVYRRFADGSITILKSPISAGGQRLTKTDPKTATAWAKVTEVLNGMDKGAAPKPVDPQILVAAIKGGSDVAVALLKLQKGRKKKKQQAVVEELPVVEETPAGIPWVPIAAAGAGLLLLFMLSRKSAGS